jgi:hypothetical protein
MMISHTPATGLFLLVWLSIWSAGCAYTKDSTPRHPFLAPTSIQGGKAVSRPKRSVSYDFGLGKNPPVAKSTRYGENASGDTCHHPQQPITQQQSSPRPPLFVEAIAQYLVEHEAVREYPSPNRIIPATTSIGKKKRAYPVFIVPKRMTGDGILWIQGTHSIPSVITAQTPGRHFELNTLWVELLIHEQQKKLAVAAP